MLTATVAGAGEIESDTTLGPGVVALDADLTVPPGRVLTIAPGTVLQVAPAIGITVLGTLDARATADGPIVFEGADDDGDGQPWAGLTMGDTSAPATFDVDGEWTGGSILDGVTIQGASRGLHLQGASPYVVGVTFQDNHFEPEGNDTVGGAGLYITGGSTSRVEDCRFIRNTVGGYAQGAGVFTDQSPVTLVRNHFEGNRAFYGAGLTANFLPSPVAYSTFIDNEADWEGGGASLVSSSPAFVGNTLQGNHAGLDGGGLHVCVTCYPHAAPVIIDNTIVGNTNLGHGAAGVGAAWLRGFSHNEIHDNTRGGEANDFVWQNQALDAYPAWVHSPQLPHNWWGTTDAAAVEQMVWDGADEDGFGRVDVTPLAEDAPAGDVPRVVITTLKLHYDRPTETMPVYLSLLNPGAARDVLLRLFVQLEDGPLTPWRGAMPLSDTPAGPGAWLVSLPATGARFVGFTAPEFQDLGGTQATWYAVLSDPTTGALIGEPSAARTGLGE